LYGFLEKTVGPLRKRRWRARTPRPVGISVERPEREASWSAERQFRFGLDTGVVAQFEEICRTGVGLGRARLGLVFIWRSCYISSVSNHRMPMNTEEQIESFRNAYEALRTEIGKVIVGHHAIVEGTLTAVFGGGHVLLEGVPGLGKTLLVRTLGEVLDMSFNRIQFTPDLMPADILGTNIVMEAPGGRREFQFQHGPIFAHLILADEINRATPKTQSAMLEAMQEKSVTAGGEIRKLAEPFFVMATQNPIDQEGTYPLPEAQLDRFFFKLIVGYPSGEELTDVLTRTTESAKPGLARVLNKEQIIEFQQLVRGVPVASHVKDYVVRLVLATHPKTETALPISNQYLRFGSSPRGGQTLMLGAKVRALAQGRFNVSFEDIQAVAAGALRHRLILNFEAEAEGITTDHIINQILLDVPKDAGAVAA
jgi:MoxR-like ATPase